jgi:hypothetical protein
MKKKPKPQPKQPAVSIKIETYEKVKRYCEEEGIPVAPFVDQLCQDFLNEQKLNPKGGNNR